MLTSRSFFIVANLGRKGFNRVPVHNVSFLSTSTRKQLSPPNSGNENVRRRFPTYIYLAVGIPTGVMGYLYFRYLDKVPLTHRSRWIATSPEWERQLGDQEYQNLLYQFRRNLLPKNHRASVTVHRVGERIADAAKVFADQHDLVDYHTSSKTNRPTFTVVRSDMANAFVLPNNHVFVMTGLFQFVKDEDELAAVLGHEMAHTLARHVGEKVSGSFLISFLARISLLIDPSGVLFTILLPATSLLRELPHSRIQESEADQIGIHLAAQACYDPRAAKRVFRAMKEYSDQSTNTATPPEFLSTHPSHDRRINDFDKWLPDAMNTYVGDGGDRCNRLRQEMAIARKVAAQRAAQREHLGHTKRRNY